MRTGPWLCFAVAMAWFAAAVVASGDNADAPAAVIAMPWDASSRVQAAHTDRDQPAGHSKLDRSAGMEHASAGADASEDAELEKLSAVLAEIETAAGGNENDTVAELHNGAGEEVALSTAQAADPLPPRQPQEHEGPSISHGGEDLANEIEALPQLTTIPRADTDLVSAFGVETVSISRNSNLRAEPDPGAEVLARLATGDTVLRSHPAPVLGYYRVRSGGIEGWVWMMNVENTGRLDQGAVSNAEN